MATYQKCGADVESLVETIVSKYHHRLRDAEVRVDLVFAYAATDANGDTMGPALKKNGLRCYAIARNIGLKDRAKGAGDCEIAIDGDEWPTMNDIEQEALLDHELTHFELRTDKDGNLVRDDLDRPKIRIRPHDREIGWFDEVAQRHGKEAFEFRAFNSLWQHCRQLQLPFTDAIG